MDDTNDTGQIERDLAETRERMDRRLDELGERLSPNQLVNDALSHVSGGDGADFTQTLIAKAKANPLPAALAGVGIAWLLASSQNGRSRSAHDLPTRLRAAEAGVVRLDDEHPDVHASRLDDARGQVLGIARGASDTATSYAQRIKDAVASVNESARRSSHDLGDRLRGGTAGKPLSSLLTNPLALGAGAAVAGLVAGAVIPISASEEKMLGNVASQLRTKGRTAAQGLLDRGAQVGGDAVAALKESAGAHGLTADKPVGELLSDVKSGQLMRDVKEAALEVVEAGKDSLRS